MQIKTSAHLTTEALRAAVPRVLPSTGRPTVVLVLPGLDLFLPDAEALEALVAAARRAQDTLAEAALDARVDALHGPGAAAAIDQALAEGIAFSERDTWGHGTFG